jgi:hypothetical protein
LGATQDGAWYIADDFHQILFLGKKKKFGMMAVLL